MAYTPPYNNPSMVMAPFKLDEGYSEETRSLSDGDLLMRVDAKAEELGAPENIPVIPLPGWIVDLGETQRKELAYSILRSLPTSSIAAIVEALNPLLHLDPVKHLPDETILHIFEYLDAKTLLKASMASKSWRQRSLDARLWRLLYGREGWGCDRRFVRSFQEQERARLAIQRDRRARTRRAETEQEPSSRKKRMRQRGIFGEGHQNNSASMLLDGAAEATHGWTEQHGVIEADESPSWEIIESPFESSLPAAGGGDAMQDVEFHGILSAVQNSSQEPRNISFTSGDYKPMSEPCLLYSSLTGDPRVNWQYLYKQRRRLEDNWNHGRFANYQLPHPAHLYERHKECVYTLQFSGKYLVSGSRDTTLRIWNLDTQRLVMPPLQGHKLSVLCLQFDESPEEDVIMSGGSDTDVIIWRFSTGKIIRKIVQAHLEAVLNLRFNSRYLITCSKDKSIRVWSRKGLLPTDPEYPISTSASSARFPPHIIDMSGAGDIPQELMYEPLPPYSLLMTMLGHHAAVNAIQIHDYQLVSVSGDRTARVWDLHTGNCVQALLGHGKGIACVQFDGRRIVSGSSDKTIRIFDRITGGEVACLEGHNDLVRTVQARFGDTAGDLDDLESEARSIDMKFLKANNWQLPTSQQRRRGLPANAGSRDPRNITTYGAKLPPGGGGSRWARIVSGSYDEQVVIWKKDADGKWVVAHKLQQAEAVRAANRRTDVTLPSTLPAPPSATVEGAEQHHSASANPAYPPVPSLPSIPPNVTEAQYHQFLVHLQSQGVQANHSQTITHSQGPAHTPHVTHTPGYPAAGPGQGQNQILTQGQSHPQPQAQPAQAALAPLLQQAVHTGTGGGPPGPANHHNHHHPNAATTHHHHDHLPGLTHAGTSRIFKLQFDSRRIVCCSQDTRISIWDFANGDERLMEASQFFSEPA